MKSDPLSSPTLECIGAARRLVPLWFALVALFALAAGAEAGPRTSANYSITTETLDGGGARSTGGVYTNDSSLGGVTGVATVAAPAETMKAGYVGQLYEVSGLQLAATPTTVNEGSTSQLSASALLDDLTTLVLTGSMVSWGVVSGPVTSINANGLATAAAVYASANATVSGSFGGNTGTLQLTVLNVNSDNFGPYAGDGLPDDWQVLYFGPTNASGKGGPNDDFSGTGQTNRFKYVAGLNPTDPTARFVLTIAPVVAQPGQKNLIFSPRFSDRTYVVKSTTNLSPATWNPLASSTSSDNGQQRTVTDLSATGAKKLYRVEITKP